MRKANREGKSILFEAQLGSLRDLDYGIYPMTTSSNPIAAYAPVGSGYPEAKIEKVVGVVKAYSSCVGEGPFTCEWFGEEAEKLREAGGEYGAKTGRPRRVGPIDLVATRYGVQCQGATDIALTKLDVLSYMDEIPVCAHYTLNGEQTDEFPFPAILPDAKPVWETMPGWKCDISGVRKWEDLPQAARDYVEYVEGHWLPHHLCVRGSRAGFHHPAVIIRGGAGSHRCGIVIPDAFPSLFQHNRFASGETDRTLWRHPFGCLLTFESKKGGPLPCPKTATNLPWRPGTPPTSCCICSPPTSASRPGGGCGWPWPGQSTTLACPSRRSRSPSWRPTSPISTMRPPPSGKRRSATTSWPTSTLTARPLPPPPASSTWAPPAAMLPTTRTW